LDSALREKELGERFDDMFAKGANGSKIWARLQGGFFEKTRRFVILNYCIPVCNERRGSCAQEGAISD
jgi:hypothetical protein